VIPSILASLAWLPAYSIACSLVIIPMLTHINHYLDMLTISNIRENT
jgi:hypothetical protein